MGSGGSGFLVMTTGILQGPRLGLILEARERLQLPDDRKILVTVVRRAETHRHRSLIVLLRPFTRHVFIIALELDLEFFEVRPGGFRLCDDRDVLLLAGASESS